MCVSLGWGFLARVTVTKVNAISLNPDSPFEQMPPEDHGHPSWISWYDDKSRVGYHAP